MMAWLSVKGDGLLKGLTKAVSVHADCPSSSLSRTHKFRLGPMRFSVLVPAFLLPVVSLADDGRNLSFLLKRYDGPASILRRAVEGKSHK